MGRADLITAPARPQRLRDKPFLSAVETLWLRKRRALASYKRFRLPYVLRNAGVA
jgi:hypothetical protein